jgi:hypothetical protein
MVLILIYQQVSSQSYGNGWWRVWITATATSTVSSFVDIGLLDGTTLLYEGNNTSGIYVWGAQLEAGSSPTSYIKNVDAVLGTIRAADVASISGSNFSSWYRQDEGTVFSDCRLTYENSVGGQTHYEFSDGTADERFEVFGRANGGTGFRMFDGGTEQINVSPTLSSIAANTAIKIAAALKENDIAVESFDNKGLQTGTGTLPTVDRLTIGSGFNPGLNGTIRRLTYWPQRLSNDTLQTITQ